MDEENKGVPFATVLLRQASDSSFVKAEVADERGNFQLPDVAPGSYQLLLTGIGFAKRQLPVAVDGTSSDLGSIVLYATAAQLETVTVAAERPIVQVLADKTVFNVDKTLTAAGSSAWELLRKAPGVMIDNGSGIILEGKGGAAIYLNDRPSPLRGDELRAFLESLQATDIESIELITQPSSRYDAAGKAGIINIILRKDKSLGSNGSVSAGVTVGQRARYNSGVNFNTRGKRGNLYGSYSNRFGESTGFLYLRREQNGTEFDARTNGVYGRESHNGRLGYDWQASDRSTFGLLLSTNHYDGDNESNSRTPIRGLNEEVPSRVLIANNRGNSASNNYTANANYTYRDTSDRKFTIDGDLGRYRNTSYTLQPNLYFDGREDNLLSRNLTAQDAPTDIDLYSLQADYEQPLWTGALALGLKSSLVVTDNDFGFLTEQNGVLRRDEEQSNRFQYRENINAAYVNFGWKNKSWSYQLGLRAEQTRSDGQLTSRQDLAGTQVQRSYLDLFPSGGVTYSLNRKNSFALNYSRRVTRPNYSSLNPFESKIDELSFRRGNPFLQPQYSNSLKLTHTFNYRLNTSISYTHVSDFFAQITEPEGEDRNFINVRNIADQQVINLGVSYPGKLTEWWSFYVSLNAYTSSYSANDDRFVETTQQTLSGYAQQTFALPRNVSLEVSGWYSSPSVWGGTYQTRSLGSLNLAAQKTFLDDELKLRLTVNDLLFTSPWEGTTRFDGLFIDGTGGNDSRSVGLNLSWNFGRSEIRKARDRETSGKEERGRM